MNTVAQRIKRQHLEAEDTAKVNFGFWVYLMTDCVLFASLFAAFAVLRNNTFGGPSGQTLFSLPYVLTETLILLTSSFTCGLMTLAMHRKDKNSSLNWLAVTVVLGLIFLIMELTEFRHLAHEGNSWRRSGFLSSYFTLVGTHGLHIASGLVWAAILGFQLWRKGFTKLTTQGVTLFSLFWHFLDIIWIFIFTIVYLLGATKL